MEVIAAHLMAATLSLLAWMGREPAVFQAARVVMPILGLATAWNALMDGDPAWMVAVLALMGLVFICTPGRAAWFVLNPLIALAFLAHLGWLAVTA